MSEMSYMFNFLVLGDNVSVLEYLQQGGLENVSIDDTSQWHFEEDNIDLTFEVPMNLNANFDELISKSDGILYFLNPNFETEVEIFKDLIKIIQSVRKRNIPTVVIFRDGNNVITTPANQLLSWIWTMYPFEACISDLGSKNRLHMIIQTLCDSIINGEMVIIHENAWLRTPMLFSLANNEIELQNWNQAARLVEKIALISKKNQNIDWTIYAEQTAWLYAQNGDFLRASKIIYPFNPVFSNNYKKMHVDHLNSQGNQLFNEKKFGEAAQQFEMAGNWAHIELSDPELMQKSYKLSIYSWIAACETQNAFALLEKFDHNDMKYILENITQKIAGSADYLSSVGQDELAKAQLYLCFQRYQKADLFDSIKVFAMKAVKILKRILEKHINNGDVYTAKLTLDELYNIWESYDIKPDDIDDFLLRLGGLFLKVHDFQKVESVIANIESKSIQKNLTKAWLDAEEKYKQETKRYELEDLTKMNEILLDYIKEESIIFYDMNRKLYEKSDFMVYNKDFLQAASVVKKQADWLRYIGLNLLSFDVLEKVLDIYIQGELLGKFVNEIHFLPEKRRNKYLKINLDKIEKSFQNISSHIDSIEFENILTATIKLYRNHLLYDESRLFAELYIEFLKDMSIKIVNQGINKGDIALILKTVDITHQIEHISKNYLEEKKIDLDSIYSKITNYYIEQGKIKEARLYNRKIIDHDIFDVYHDRMVKIEEDEGSSIALIAKQKQQIQIYADQLSQLRNQARDQRMASQSLLRMRIGLKKRYFQKGLDLITSKNLIESAKVYCDIAKKLISTKKFELAGISAAVASLLYLLVRNIPFIQEEIDGFQFKSSRSRKIFFDTFPLRLIQYILMMIKAKKIKQIKECLKLFESLALFPEERLVLETLIGDDSDIQALVKEPKSILEEPQKIPSNYDLLIEKLVVNPELKTKRLTLEKKYWSVCQHHLYHQQYEDASTCYLELVNDLLKRKLDFFVVDSIIMGFLLQLKIKQANEVYSFYERYMYQLNKKIKDISKLEQFQLLDIVIRFWNKPIAIYMLRDITTAFEIKLHLFEWECLYIKSLVANLVGEQYDDENQTISVTMNDSKVISEPKDALLQKQGSILHEDLSKLKSNYSDLHKKRQKMIRTYYKDIVVDLQNQNFLDAAEKYEKLAKRMARRNDFDSSSLMILLSVLSRIRGRMSLPEIKSKIDSLLGSLGIVKKILDDNFGIKVAFFVIDTLSTNIKTIEPLLLEILNELPLLNEEKILINIFH